MEKKPREVKHIIFIVLSGTICCTVFGLVFFGLQVGHIKPPVFYFASLGFTGSVAFSFFEPRKFREGIPALLLIFLLTHVIAHFPTVSFDIVYSIYFIGIVLAAFLFGKFIYRQSENVWFARPLILAGIVSLMAIAATALQWIAFAGGDQPFHILTNVTPGFLFGLGLGIGFEIAAYFWPECGRTGD